MRCYAKLQTRQMMTNLNMSGKKLQKMKFQTKSSFICKLDIIMDTPNTNDPQRKLISLYEYLKTKIRDWEDPNGEQNPELTSVEDLSERPGLDLDAAQMEEMPVDISLLTNLKFLAIKGKEDTHAPIKNISKEIILLKLKDIDFSWNSITEIPSGFLPMTLTHLNLEGNHIEIVSEGILSLKNLRELNLADNNITVLPKLHMRKLEDFNIARNQLRTIPSFTHMKKMRRIGLNSNNIATVADNTLPASLIILEFSNNRLKIIPDEILRLQNLWFLDLRYNKITKISRKLKNMPGLKNLYLKGNEVAIPEFAQKMANPNFVSPDY